MDYLWISRAKKNMREGTIGDNKSVDRLEVRRRATQRSEKEWVKKKGSDDDKSDAKRSKLVPE